MRRRERIERSLGRAHVCQAQQHRQHVAKDIPLLPEEGEIHEAQVQVPIARTPKHVVVEQLRPAVVGNARRKRVEQAVEVVVRFPRMRDPVEAFDEIPQRVRVENEA